MHANVQTRFNPAIGEKAPYYRLKESYRDVRGNVHSLILLNVGFDPSIDALQAKKIARALTNRFENRHATTLFSERLNGLTEYEQAKADEWWNRMIQEGGIDRFDKREQAARLLGCQHYTLRTQSAGRELLLAGDRSTYVDTEVSHHRRCQSAGRKGRNATMLQALETSHRDLPKARLTRSTLQENQNL